MTPKGATLDIDLDAFAVLEERERIGKTGRFFLEHPDLADKVLTARRDGTHSLARCWRWLRTYHGFGSSISMFGAWVDQQLR